MADDNREAEAGASPQETILRMLTLWQGERETLEVFDRYHRGDHPTPYMPDTASAEYRLLVERSVSNRMRLLVDAPMQSLYLEGYRSSEAAAEPEKADIGDSPAWRHFQRSRLGGRQHTLYKSAFVFGHAFLVAERDPRSKKQARAKILSAMNTVALFADPVNDIDPQWAMTVIQNDPTMTKGRGKAWDDTYVYEFRFDLGRESAKDRVKVTEETQHGAKSNPVTRFACELDAEGRTTGLVEPMIRVQDRLNQTVFDLLVVQTGGSFKTKYATGMVLPKKLDEEGDPVLDGNGNEVPLPVRIDGRTFLTSEDTDTKFGTLDGTPLDGYINSIEQANQEWAATGQIPPNHVLGQLANLSAEALAAAEKSFSRMVEGFRSTFGEAWERHFQVVAEIEGTSGADDHQGQAIWRDMESQSLSRTADALTKLAKGLEIPARGLWSRVPGVRAEELAQWHNMWDDDNPGYDLEGLEFNTDIPGGDVFEAPSAGEGVE